MSSFSPIRQVAHFFLKALPCVEGFNHEQVVLQPASYDKAAESLVYVSHPPIPLINPSIFNFNTSSSPPPRHTHTPIPPTSCRTNPHSLSRLQRKSVLPFGLGVVVGVCTGGRGLAGGRAVVVVVVVVVGGITIVGQLRLARIGAVA